MITKDSINPLRYTWEYFWSGDIGVFWKIMWVILTLILFSFIGLSIAFVIPAIIIIAIIMHFMKKNTAPVVETVIKK